MPCINRNDIKLLHQCLVLFSDSGKTWNAGKVECKHIFYHIRSREEIALWKEKKAQVAREEMRVKDSLARTTAESSSRVSFDGATLPEHAQDPGKVCIQ